MNFPIVHEYRTDILNLNPENRVLGEPFTAELGPGNRIVIPIHAPFFVKSLRLYNANMEPLVKADDEGVGDWRMYKIMGGLTELTAKPVGCMIEILNPDITAGFFDYDIVGHFSLFDNTLLRLILETANDDRPVYWKYLRNKPKVFPPELHGMSLIYDMVAFGDMVELITMLINYLNDNAKSVVQIKIEHYLDLLNSYINVYRTELLKSLARHEGGYDSHGLTKGQVGLPLVDNFATARGDDLLKPNNDMHVTVGGLRTIINTLSFNAPELLVNNKVPVSQFGNANFIPPSLDGSFEGLGSFSESAAICRESDGSISLLSNRLDGRVTGLYFSLMEVPANVGLTTLTYTGFKYVHPKFVPDGANVNLVAPGSGDEVILVGDSIKQLFYIGVTNGSLDPSKHVYSKIDLTPIRNAVAPTTSSLSSLFPFLSIALMGDWIYLFQGCRSPNPVPNNVGSSMGFRMVFRVALADVKATVNVTPVRQLVSFTDTDGVSATNSPFLRLYDTFYDNGLVAKKFFTFVQPTPEGNTSIGTYSLHSLAAQRPDAPGKYAMKFVSGAFATGTSNGISRSFSTAVEINYDFDPVTGVFTYKTKSIYPPIDWSSPTPIPPEYAVSSASSYSFIFSFNGCGMVVLADGSIVGSQGYGSFSGFPRAGTYARINNAISKFAVVDRFFDKWKDFTFSAQPAEKVVSPIASSGYVRSVQFYPTGELYNAGDKTDLATLKPYWRNVSGKYVQRANVSNLFVPNLYSRPLTNDVYELNAPVGLGGAVVSGPSAQMTAAGAEVGDSMLCMNTQRKYQDRNEFPGTWTAPVGPDDILLIDSFTFAGLTDGKLNIQPIKETLYPAALVETMKSLVEFPAIMATSPEVIVTVCDPSNSVLSRFGKLPIMASVCHRGTPGQSNAQTFFTTFMIITPVYTTDANGRRVATNFTINSRQHYSGLGQAIDGLRSHGGLKSYREPAATNFTSMRAMYYVNGNTANVRFESGVVSRTTSDAQGLDWVFSMSSLSAGTVNGAITPVNKSSSVPCATITPDNGISPISSWGAVSGGAATIQQGSSYNALIGSVYPEVGWVIFAQSEIKVVFNGMPYVIPPGIIDLRDVSTSPANKTFYIYAVLVNGTPVYQVVEDKRLETPFQLWVAKVVTGPTQILTIERYNVFAMNGNRVSEIKRGNSIPASSGLANEEGQLPWLRSDEILP